MTKNTNIPKLRFPEFKKEWLNSTLGDKVEIVGGGTPETNIEEYWNGDINWFTPTEIKSKYVSESQRKITEKALKSSSAKLLPIGAVLLTTRATIGLSAITNTLSTTNQGFQSFLPNSNVNNEFIYYWTKTKLNEFIKRANGSTFIEISKNSLKEIDFTSPELEEQTKIASFLTAVDDKLQALKKKKKLLELYKKGMMQQLFSQETRFKKDDGTNYPDWEEKKLGEVCNFSNGKAHENEINENGKYIVVNSKFVSSGGTVKKFSNKQIVPLFKDDIVMVMSDVPNGKALAKCYLIESDEKYTLNQRICVLRAKRSYNSFLIYLINRNEFYLSFDSGVGQTNLKKEDVLNCPLYIPSSLEEQSKIANFLSAIDDKIAHCQSESDGLEQWKKGLLQQMFC